jgi:hypothetical protein
VSQVDQGAERVGAKEQLFRCFECVEGVESEISVKVGLKTRVVFWFFFFFF